MVVCLWGTYANNVSDFGMRCEALSSCSEPLRIVKHVLSPLYVREARCGGCSNPCCISPLTSGGHASPNHRPTRRNAASCARNTVPLWSIRIGVRRIVHRWPGASLSKCGRDNNLAETLNNVAHYCAYRVERLSTPCGARCKLCNHVSTRVIYGNGIEGRGSQPPGVL